VIALYLKISQQGSAVQNSVSINAGTAAVSSSAWQGILLALCIALLTSSRMQLLPLLLLLWSCSRQTGQKKYLYYALAAGIFTLTWILLSITTVVDTKVTTSLTPMQAISFYLVHPITGVQVLFSTLTNLAMLKSYATSFIGVLGWLDASLPKVQYGLLGALLVLLVALCFSWRPQGLAKYHQRILVLCAVCSMGIVFAALLIQWTPHPATIILGVQGRYFFVPALLVFIAFTRPFSPSYSFHLSSVKSWVAKTSLAVLVLLGGTALYCTSALLLGRYYLMPEQADVSQLRPIWIAPSSQDDKSAAIALVFSAYQTQHPARLQSISLFLDAAPAKGAQSTAPTPLVLQLWNAQGQVRQIAASTSATAASGYLTINIPQDAYTKGQIVVNQDHALRIKGVQQSNGDQGACVIYELSDGSRRYTPGCP
jgi:hypothetical protein